MQLANYLFFTTMCEQALDFYTKCGLGKISIIVRYGDNGMPVPVEAFRGKIMHSRFEGPGVLFYASDNPDAEPMRGSASHSYDGRPGKHRSAVRSPRRRRRCHDAARHAALGRLLRQADRPIWRAVDAQPSDPFALELNEKPWCKHIPAPKHWAPIAAYLLSHIFHIFCCCVLQCAPVQPHRWSANNLANAKHRQIRGRERRPMGRGGMPWAGCRRY
jgi:hypothetical protein